MFSFNSFLRNLARCRKEKACFEFFRTNILSSGRGTKLSQFNNINSEMSWAEVQFVPVRKVSLLAVTQPTFNNRKSAKCLFHGNTIYVYPPKNGYCCWTEISDWQYQTFSEALCEFVMSYIKVCLHRPINCHACHSFTLE